MLSISFYIKCIAVLLLLVVFFVFLLLFLLIFMIFLAIYMEEDTPMCYTTIGRSNRNFYAISCSPSYSAYYKARICLFLRSSCPSMLASSRNELSYASSRTKLRIRSVLMSW